MSIPRQQTRRPRITHEQTAASKENAAIQSALVKELNTYVNMIRRQLDRHPNVQWTYLRGNIEPKLRPIVEQTIRASVTKSYQLGAEYVTERAGLAGASFLTHSDIDQIKALSGEFTDKFFGRVQISLDATLKRSRAEERADSPFNPNYIVTSVAVSATSKALATGSKEKATALLHIRRTNNSNTPIQQAQAIPEEINEDLFFSSGATIEDLTAETLQTQKWTWITNVGACEICQGLEGQVWDIDDPDIPTPIEDSHPSCFCRLLLL